MCGLCIEFRLIGLLFGSSVPSVSYTHLLTWLDPHTLQVAVPEDVKLEDQRASDTYDGYLLRYVYRLMLEGEPAFGGCGLGTAQSGT